MRRVTQEEALALLDAMQAVRDGHFIGSSDRHLSAYVRKDTPTLYPSKLRILAEGAAYLVQNLPVDVIAAPPMGALSLGTMVAEELGVKYVYLEPEGDSLQVVRPEFQEAVRGVRVGLAEDILTSGKTTVQSAAAIAEQDGTVVYVTGLFNRGGLTAEGLGVPRLQPLITKELPSWPDKESCDLCKQKVPIVSNIGHSRRFREQNPDFDIEYVEI